MKRFVTQTPSSIVHRQNADNAPLCDAGNSSFRKRHGQHIAMLGLMLFVNRMLFEDDLGIWNQEQQHAVYVPSFIEKYIVNHTVELGYDKFPSSGCTIWADPSATPPHIYEGLQLHAQNLEKYTAIIDDFEPIPDLLESIQRNGNHDVCATARPHPDGIAGIFGGELSWTTSAGFIEPLLPPMRSGTICPAWPSKKIKGRNIMNMNYLVHDFEAMCRALKPTSKRILIDMGASLDFDTTHQPIMFLLNQFEKFGFRFDHIYAFEVKGAKPQHVYDMIPQKYMSSYHWINVGVTAEEGHKLNPLHSILKQFDPNDFIVVKLDIDTPSIEVPLFQQLLQDPIYKELVDQFYFEHHVGLKELIPYWGRGLNQTVKQSIDMFLELREKGIPAHFWP